MNLVTHNPTDGIYAPVGDYVHGLEVRDPSRLLYIAGVRALNGRCVPTTAIVAQTLVSDWLVEIEVIAAA